MKTIFDLFKKHRCLAIAVVTAIVVTTVAISAALAINQTELPIKPDQNVASTDSATSQSLLADSSSAVTEESESISSEENPQVSPSEESSSQNVSSVPSSKKPSSTVASSHKGSTPTSSSSTSSTSKQDYLDTSKVAFTQNDVGLIVGYSTTMARDIVVIQVDESPTADGRRCVRLILGYAGLEEIGGFSPTGFCKVECAYCREFPCSQDGRLNCPKYDPLKDGAVTCQTCGKPKGNGYYGTCEGLLNWNDPTKPFHSCNHYSNCLNCGKPVGDGYNGTCHVTWGNRSSETTCNHYD